MSEWYICKQCGGRVKDEERAAHLNAEHSFIFHNRYNCIGVQGHIDQNFTREEKHEDI